ncbi:iron-sulfur cluster assembly scaffold protein [Candidatus Mycoplasma haematohominis]|uniref:NifU-like protein n=1 Tax=Candidatus Mycoplasma haematohominis TaxID=1494318 RepID=A0A478FQH3_9MOLU|nr:iron-sulfur cluster assembly scaffold protein [Candidatus Mycoplasma haemohominis]GCE63347.1 hypothetical protein MHSWG343_03360 [Candidatus Mycoplasma haemohominis]
MKKQDLNKLKIFNLGISKKYEKKLPYINVPTRASKTSMCEDWCEISIATVEPVISNIYFSHRGCLLSRACINAILHSIENKTKDEALNILFSFRKMLSTGIASPSLPEELKLFCKFSKFPSRKECLLLGCNLIVEELNSRSCF